MTDPEGRDLFDRASAAIARLLIPGDGNYPFKPGDTVQITGQLTGDLTWQGFTAKVRHCISQDGGADLAILDPLEDRPDGHKREWFCWDVNYLTEVQHRS